MFVAAPRPSLSRVARSCLLAAALGAFAAAAGAAEPALLATPLAPRSGPRGATMFKLMPPSQTGVVTENPYADPKMWSDHYQEYVYGAIGCGIAAGDFDHDGRPDLFVVSKTGQCRLFRNLGDWRFEDVTAKAGLTEGAGGWLDRAKSLIGSSGSGLDAGAWKQGAAFVDVNNDGWLDIYVCRFNAPNLLYINQRDGTFKEEAGARGLALASDSGMAAFCDYDRDGWLDVYIQTNMLDASKRPKGEPDYLFHNNGDGTFTNVTERAGIRGDGCTHSATWWDYDGDGWPDLYASNDYDVPDRLYHNNHDGTFSEVAAAVVPHTPYYAMGADLGDVNNDGRMDLLVADMAASNHEKDQRGMAGSRDRAQLAATDLSAPQFMRSALYLNTGLGRMREAAYLTGLAATDWTWSVRFEDLDNDGRIDLHVTNGMVREFHNADVLSRIMAADSIADSWRMVRALPPMREHNFAFRNLGDLAFEDVSAAWGLDQLGISFGAAFADFDGDGDLDLAYANYEAGVTLLRNDSDTGHRLVVALHGTRSNRFGVGSTVRIETASGAQVRTLVLARGQMSTSEPILHFGLGQDTTIQHLTVSWPSGATQTFDHVAADQHLVITEPADAPRQPPNAPPLTVAQRLASAQFVREGEPLSFTPTAPRVHVIPTQPFLPMSLGQSPRTVAIGAIGGVAPTSILVAPRTGAGIQVFHRGMDGRFDAAETMTTDSELPDGPVLVFDANGDGADDVLVTRAVGALLSEKHEHQPTLLLNDGHGHLQPAPVGALPDLPIGAGAAVAADFDRDGRLDVFLGGRGVPGKYPLTPQSALLVNRGGRFEDVTDTLAPGLRNVGMVTSALWSDADGDGWLDLVIALDWGNVKLFHNDEGHGFSDWTNKVGFDRAGTGWWNAIASADFNGDGRPDYVVGNLGLNTRYHADPAHPAVMYYGDFADDGAPFLIEGYYEGDRLFPWITRNALGTKLPSVLRRFPRNDLYARATLPEIVGEQALKQATRVAATELRSGVLLSQADGTYAFEPLPRIAQISIIRGLAAGDFDGDGKADIYAVQNSYAPVPSIGDIDGGLSQLLRGDGHGHFTAVEPIESGLVVPGEGTPLVVTDLNDDGWPDFVLSPEIAFRNRGVAGRHSLRIELHGSGGNVDAIGARVTLECRDGMRQTAEITAGSGYLSQSLAACFFGYLNANPPRQLTVRWPDGKITTHPVPNGATKLVLEQLP